MKINTATATVVLASMLIAGCENSPRPKEVGVRTANLGVPANSGICITTIEGRVTRLIDPAGISNTHI
jgi:hypothetical protein